MDSDYEIVKRTTDTSGKYFWAKYNQPAVDIQNSIVISHADMQYKFSPDIYKKFLQIMGQPHLGYQMPKNSFKTALVNWIKHRYDCHDIVYEKHVVSWCNTLAAVHACIEIITEVGEEILIMCPTYYFFLDMISYKKRKAVQYVLETRANRLYIDFQKLEQVIKASKIKLAIFCNPFNPCGRIWLKEELSQLAQLAAKYKFYFVSDEIYSDAVELTPRQQQQNLQIKDIFTSMLTIPSIRPYLIYVSSYTKSYNCAALPLSYTVCFNEQLQDKLVKHMSYTTVYACPVSAAMLQAIYTSEQAKVWIKNTSAYLRNNYNIFVKECAEKLPKLFIYELQCSYLCLVDFKQYNLAGEQLQSKFTSVNVCPTFMQGSFVTKQPRSLVRLNLAINQSLIYELVERMRKMLVETN